MAIKVQEIKGKGKEELEILLREKRAELVHDRFGASARQLKNVRRIGVAKKDIARILTVMKMQQQEGQDQLSDK